MTLREQVRSLHLNREKIFLQRFLRMTFRDQVRSLHPNREKIFLQGFQYSFETPYPYPYPYPDAYSFLLH